MRIFKITRESLRESSRSAEWLMNENLFLLCEGPAADRSWLSALVIGPTGAHTRPATQRELADGEIKRSSTKEREKRPKKINKIYQMHLWQTVKRHGRLPSAAGQHKKSSELQQKNEPTNEIISLGLKWNASIYFFQNRLGPFRW